MTIERDCGATRADGTADTGGCLYSAVAVVAGLAAWAAALVGLSVIRVFDVRSDFPAVTDESNVRTPDQITMLAGVTVGFLLCGFAAARVARRAKITHALAAGAAPFVIALAVGISVDPSAVSAKIFAVRFVPALLAALAGGWLGRLLSPANTRQRTAWGAYGRPWTYHTRDGTEIKVRTARVYPRTAGAFYFAGILGMMLATLTFLNGYLFANLFTIAAMFLCIHISYRISTSLVSEVFDGSKPPVVYLRSFRVDVESPWRSVPPSALMGAPGVFLASLTRTPEESTCETLAALGPIVAIGLPGEAMPPLGATRVYVQDSDWQAVAADLINRSQIVVLRAGESPGFLWELDQVMRALSPRQVLLLLFFPAGLHKRSRQESYDLFRASAGSRFACPLPEQINNATVLYFGDAWEPHLLGPALRKDGPGPTAEALERHPLRQKIQEIATIYDPGKPFFDTRGLKWLVAVLVVYLLVLLLNRWLSTT